MSFSNKCGRRPNLRRMDRFISMIIMLIKIWVAQRHKWPSDTANTRECHDNFNAPFIDRDRSTTARRLSADLGEAVAKRVQTSGRSARAIHRGSAIRCREAGTSLAIHQGVHWELVQIEEVDLLFL